MPLSEMANLFISLHLAVAPGLVCSLIICLSILSLFFVFQTVEVLALFRITTRTIWLHARHSFLKQHVPCFVW